MPDKRGGGMWPDMIDTEKPPSLSQFQEQKIKEEEQIQFPVGYVYTFLLSLVASLLIFSFLGSRIIKESPAKLVVIDDRLAAAESETDRLKLVIVTQIAERGKEHQKVVADLDGLRSGLEDLKREHKATYENTVKSLQRFQLFGDAEAENWKLQKEINTDLNDLCKILNSKIEKNKEEQSK